MRKPFERTIAGQYKTKLEGMDKFAENVAKELCEKYPDVDLIDIEFMFEKTFAFAMAMESVKYGAKVNKENGIT